METLFKAKKTHRSCFRRLILTFLSRDVVKEKNAEKMFEEYSDLIEACHGKYLMNFNKLNLE